METLLGRFARTGDRRLLAFTPAHRRPEFAALAGPRWQTEPQSAGNLGLRIERYFSSAFATGATHVLLMGSDSPTLPEPLVAEAFERLTVADAVLGPTDDGGYYLIGLARQMPGLFDAIAWSTPAVWRQTIERLEALACRYHVLAPWYDIDTLADLARLCAELEGDASEEFSGLRHLILEVDDDGCPKRPA